MIVQRKRKATNLRRIFFKERKKFRKKRKNGIISVPFSLFTIMNQRLFPVGSDVIAKYEYGTYKFVMTKKDLITLMATTVYNSETLPLTFEEESSFEIAGEIAKPIRAEDEGKEKIISEGYYLLIPIEGQMIDFITHGKEELDAHLKKEWMKIQKKKEFKMTIS